jgi:hypothetical protein
MPRTAGSPRLGRLTCRPGTYLNSALVKEVALRAVMFRFWCAHVAGMRRAAAAAAGQESDERDLDIRRMACSSRSAGGGRRRADRAGSRQAGARRLASGHEASGGAEGDGAQGGRGASGSSRSGSVTRRSHHRGWSLRAARGDKLRGRIWSATRDPPFRRPAGRMGLADSFPVERRGPPPTCCGPRSTWSGAAGHQIVVVLLMAMPDHGGRDRVPCSGCAVPDRPGGSRTSDRARSTIVSPRRSPTAFSRSRRASAATPRGEGAAGSVPVRRRRPDLLDGDRSARARSIRSGPARPRQLVAGYASVLVFPDLTRGTSGTAGAALAGARAYGPS